MPELETLSDDELDTALAHEYDDHRRAMSCGDKVETGACHIAIRAILAEQSRRLDAWLKERAG